jgi:hypothetical protein
MGSSSTGGAGCNAAIGTGSGYSLVAPDPSHTLLAVHCEIIYGLALQASLFLLHNFHIGMELGVTPCESLPHPIMVHPKECVQVNGTTRQ